MSVKCWASVAGAGQYLFSPSQYFILPYLHACGTGTKLWIKGFGPSSVTLAHIQCGVRHDTVTQYWANAG